MDLSSPPDIILYATNLYRASADLATPPEETAGSGITASVPEHVLKRLWTDFLKFPNEIPRIW